MAFSFGADVAAAQTEKVTCESLRAAKAKIYGFHPAQLSEAALETKGKEMDAFWKQLQSAGAEGTTCLRAMLAEEKTDHYFQFDGGSMLSQLDRSPEALTLVRDAIAQADFQESDPANYLTLALDLSQAGVDVRPLAAKLLRFPNATIHISEHSLDLDSDTAALFLYGSMQPGQASNALIAELDADSFRALSQWKGTATIEEDFRKNDIQSVMKYQAPNAADLAQPKFNREQVLKILAGLPHTRKEFDVLMATKGAAFDKQMRDTKATQEEIAKAVAEREPIYGIAAHTAFLKSAVAALQPEDLEILRDARRKSLYNVSDESLDEYLAFTQVMIGLINRLDLYKEFRAH